MYVHIHEYAGEKNKRNGVYSPLRKSGCLIFNFFFMCFSISHYSHDVINVLCNHISKENVKCLMQLPDGALLPAKCGIIQ